jgi:hypothetical protein
MTSWRAKARAVTRWDARVFARAAAGATGALVLAVSVGAASDEGGLTWAQRIGRALPLAPLCAAIGVWAALAPVKFRGESLALGALGRTGRGISAAAVAGAALVALAASLSIAAPSMDVASFYPTASRGTAWTWRDGAFVDPVDGLRLDSRGMVVEAPVAEKNASSPTPASASASGTPPGGRTAASFATALAGLAMALFTAAGVLEGRRRLADASLCAFALAASVALFQAAAARLTPALAASLPAALLLGLAARRYRSLD